MALTLGLVAVWLLLSLHLAFYPHASASVKGGTHSAEQTAAIGAASSVFCLVLIVAMIKDGPQK